ncbi:hypothetical protein SH2C18_22060 [Clostridium sediminicola]|uniref:Ig-like domain-containing protein n=1 Tax=Clostridium sediminicola TaxID=3114879 RepID=UPI0031F1E76C
MKKRKLKAIIIGGIFLIGSYTAYADELKEPKICLDFPRLNTEMNSDFLVSGWALNDSGVKEVKIYVDGEYTGNATSGLARPDVDGVYPGYKDGNESGYSYEVDVDVLSAGIHNIKIQSIGNDGTSVETVREVNVVKAAPKICLDFPRNNEEIDSDFYISGWSLNQSGINEVKIFIDNELIGNATTGIVRPDVNEVFPGYKDGDKSGYRYDVDIDTISSGKHSLKIRSIGNDGTSIETTKQIDVVKASPKIYLDYPNVHKDIEANFYIGGWSLNSSGIREVKIFMDNQYIGNATTGISRQDVNAAFPGYKDGDKSGFSYVVDIGSISKGIHNFEIQSIGNDGTSTEITRQINIVKLEPRIAMDFPRENSEIENSFSVGGWALNPSAVKTVEVYVDDVFKGNATIGIERPDVNEAFPGYKEGDIGGYNFNIDIDTIKAGTRSIKVRAIGYDGSTIESSTNIDIVKIPSKIAVDTPRMDTEIKSNFYVNGWVINASGIKEVNIYVDDKYMGQADIGIPRPDVNSVYPGYRNGDRGGYSYDLSVYDISLGKHVVNIQAVGVDGELINTYTNIDVKDNTKRFVYSQKTLDEMIQAEYARNPKYGTGREATIEEVAYYVNPDNFVHSEYGRYMFMKLSYMDGIDVNDLNSMLGGKGVLQGKGDVFLKAGKNSGINPIYLISHALLETGNGTSKLANGSLSYNGATIYNAYGVGATDANPNLYGSKYAYEHGWFTLDAAIIGGAEFISKNYIKSSKYNSNYQDTLYKMRWNDEQMWHQYATDVGWAYKQIANIKRLIDMCESSTNYFEIPTYK